MAAAGSRRAALTKRERQILGLLADGMSGAKIAEKLVLSPETVRTHVRNAMSKLGAATRSQAVAMALQSREIATESTTSAGGGEEVSRRPRAPGPAFKEMLAGLVALYDVDGGAVYLADEDGLALNRAAESHGEAPLDLPEVVPLGNGPLGRAALDRRAQLVHDSASTSPHGALIAAPILGSGRLIGVVALAARISRPVGRSELLLLQAFANRVGEVLVGGGDIGRGLERAMERFRASWSEARSTA